jgi:hypothetical protein
MRPLSPWLELMLAEIGQRQQEASAAAEEAQRRDGGAQPPANRVAKRSNAVEQERQRK